MRADLDVLDLALGREDAYGFGPKLLGQMFNLVIDLLKNKGFELWIGSSKELLLQALGNRACEGFEVEVEEEKPGSEFGLQFRDGKGLEQLGSGGFEVQFGLINLSLAAEEGLAEEVESACEIGL